MPKKTIFTLNIDNYAPEIRELTMPLIYRYAHKIRASVHEINERKFPDWPVTYEKLQIYRLAQEMNNDWNLYIDSDALIHPEMPDVTEIIPADTVSHNGFDHATVRWKTNDWARRDGRFIGSCNWMTCASRLCVDLWRPLDMAPDEAVSNIFPSVGELTTVVQAPHLVDDYALSQNIARFGLKFVCFQEAFKVKGINGNFLWHQYTMTQEDKLKSLSKVLSDWGIRPECNLNTSGETVPSLFDMFKGEMA